VDRRRQVFPHSHRTLLRRPADMHCAWILPQYLYCRWLSENPKGAVAVAAINALTTLIKNSGASTIVELDILLKAAQDKLQEVNFEGQRSKVIQLTAACELFARHVTRTALDISDFEICKQHLIERGQRFATKADVSRTVIAENMLPFLRDGMTILVHGYSNVVCGGLLSAAKGGKRFKVLFAQLRRCRRLPSTT